MRRIVRLALVAATVATIGGAAAVASASDNRPRILDANLAGLPATLTGQTLFGVTAGGAPWRLDGGRAKLFSDGRLQVEVRGLVLAAGPLEGTNPIPHGEAIVTCQGAVAARSVPVDYSADGDATVDQTVALPDGCLAPVVFFSGVPNPAVPTTAPWFAVTGFGD
ncbi:MAG TPA: hypothetical protein VFI28_10165 [Candidatus Limnocylindrales bacterium]|nr:hypothetical protein [Candidatus Limnocylindrales bacterium]